MANPLETHAQKTSYALGLDIGTNLSRLPIEADADAFVAGVRDVIEDNPLQISREEFEALMQDLHRKMQEGSERNRTGAANNNREAGDSFRTENAAREGVTVTDSGLQYEVISEGTGARPEAGDTVRVHYIGTLIDGTVFDSSVARGEPAEFPLNRVIPGWTEGVQLMTVGSKFRFCIPPELAYGEQGAGNAIGPNSTLVFDVELLDILNG